MFSESSMITSKRFCKILNYLSNGNYKRQIMHFCFQKACAFLTGKLIVLIQRHWEKDVLLVIFCLAVSPLDINEKKNNNERIIWPWYAKIVSHAFYLYTRAITFIRHPALGPHFLLTLCHFCKLKAGCLISEAYSEPCQVSKSRWLFWKNAPS